MTPFRVKYTSRGKIFSYVCYAMCTYSLIFVCRSLIFEFCDVKLKYGCV